MSLAWAGERIHKALRPSHNLDFLSFLFSYIQAYAVLDSLTVYDGFS